MRTLERPGELAERILLGLLASMQAEEQLPTVRELVKRHGASTETWRRMMHKLSAGGYLKIVEGWGAFYTGKPIGPEAKMTGSRPAASAHQSRGETARR